MRTVSLSDDTYLTLNHILNDTLDDETKLNQQQIDTLDDNDSEQIELSKASVLSVYENKLQNHVSIHSATKLIQILGGCDQILTDYLTSTNEMMLSQKQLQKIHQIITSEHQDMKPENIQPKSGTKSISQGSNSGAKVTANVPGPSSRMLSQPAQQSIVRHVTTDIQNDELALNSPSTRIRTSTTIIIPTPKSKMNESRKQLLYTFKKTDTMLHSKLGNKLAAKIISVLYSKITIGIWLFLCFVWIIWANIAWNIEYYIYKLLIFFPLMIYAAVFMLSVNKTVIKKSTAHFVFWFKILVCIEAAMAGFWLRYVLFKDRDIASIEIMGDIFARAASILLIAVYSSIDGFPISRQAKIWTGVGFSFIYTIDAVTETFVVGDDHAHDLATMYISDGFGFSILSIYINALRVLSVFLWKQTILAVINKNECINIRHSPFLQWVG